MACPFFMPTERLTESPWAHPSRLPLGDSWGGQCTAPGHENDPLSSAELKHCNVGYAAKYCPRVPAERPCDAIRFSVVHDKNRGAPGKIIIFYVCEIQYRPGEHGTLEFDAEAEQWTSRHADARIQRMAECYLQSYLARPRGNGFR